jgi:hypothetical protein
VLARVAPGVFDEPIDRRRSETFLAGGRRKRTRSVMFEFPLGVRKKRRSIR